jgi:hypothetical protein
LEKIAKLLALAEAAGTAEEAEAAFAKAQSLAAKFSIDLAVAQSHQADRSKREVPVTRTVTIGERGKRANASLINLYDTIARANDVSVLISSNNTTVYPTGFPSDLDAVDALWASLAATMVKFGDALVRDRSAAWRSETTQQFNYSTYSYETRPVSGQGARKSFYTGFISRIGQRLQEARRAAETVAAAEHFHGGSPEAGAPVAELAGGQPVPSSMALVLREKRAEVAESQDAWYQARHGRGRKPGSWKGGGNRGTWSSSANGAGRAAADRASLSGRRSLAS